jgi:1-phosphatidylinositol-3-phosphate 5-kinase
MLIYIVTHAAPIYLREHGKRMLRGALWNDTNFLQNVNVMDYSLLVGVDDQSNELVLGIVGKHTVQFPIHYLMRQ